MDRLNPRRLWTWAGLAPGFILGLLGGLVLACGPKSEPVPADLAWLRAQNAEAEGRFDWARIYYRQDLAAHPDRLASQRGEAISWLSGYQQSLSQGALLLRRYLERQPDDDLVQRLVRTLLLLGDWEQARTWVDRLAPSPAADLLRAEAWLPADLEVAHRAASQALGHDPQLARGHALLAQIAESRGQPEDALFHAREAVARDPFDFQSFYLIGRLLRQQGDRAGALQALELHQGLRQLFHDGTMQPLAPEAALTLFEKLLPQLPQATFAVKKKQLELLFQTGRLGPAQALAEELAAAPLASRQDLLEVATWAGEQGRTALARKLFTQVQASHPQDRGANASLALLDLDRGELAAASTRLQAALAADPHFARYHYLLGRVARAQDQPQVALAHWLQATLLAPWEWPWREDLANLLLSLGEIERFQAVLSETPEETPAAAAYRSRHADLLATK